MFGLDLGDNKRIPQVVALGDLAVDIHDAIGNEGRHLSGMPVTVSGELLRVPWEKGGKPMRAFQRLVLARIETPDWTLPAPEVGHARPGAAARCERPLPDRSTP